MIAEEIQNIQKKLGFSVSQMARELGVSRGTYDKWQRGDQKAPAIAIQAIKMLVFIVENKILEKFHDVP